MAILILDAIGRVFLEICSLKSLFLGGDEIIGGDYGVLISKFPFPEFMREWNKETATQSTPLFSF